MNDNDYNWSDDFAKSIEDCYRAIKDRVANGGPGWNGYPGDGQVETAKPIEG